MDNSSFQKYSKDFSEKKFWKKLPKSAQQIGIKTVYTALLMFFAYRLKETPTWAKNIALGALGYLIAPIDIIPDLTPLLGFTDDISVLSFGLVAIAGNINEAVRLNARKKLSDWFGDFDGELLHGIDQKL